MREQAANSSLPSLEIIDPNDIVVCCYCKKSFNKKELKYKEIKGGKYAHIGCAELEEKREKTDAEKLDIYIMELFDIDYVNPRIKKQINSYIKEYKFTYSGILKALKYFYEIKKGSIEKANGSIGIVPYIYQEAREYYIALFLAQQKNKDKRVYSPKVKEVHIPIPQRNIKKRNLFSFLDEQEGINP